jgi:predicted permease
MTSWLRKITWLFQRSRKEAELQEELQFHLDEAADERIADGEDAESARYASQRELGNLTRVAEDTRDAWTWTILEQLRQDLRYGVRMLFANKTFSGLAILSLALGIGANTAIFSFMDAMLLRPLPVSDPHSLVTLAWHTKKPEMHGSNRHEDSYEDPEGGWVGGVFPYGAFELFQRDTSVFTTVFGYQGAGELHLAVNGQAQIANAEYVSGNYFSGLGVPPAAGRLLNADDDRFGAPAVAVISYGLSEARFGGPANASGQPILLDNIPFTVVGVTPPEFFGADPAAHPLVYVPMHTNVLLQAPDKYARARERYADPGFDWIVPMARLRPGVTAAQAQAALGPVFADWKASTDTTRTKDDLPTLVVKESSGGLDGLRRTYSKPLYVLLALVGLVLAIACVNIASLLLARASARSREMAVRLSIGAGRLRVIRQLLTESLLLSGLGATLGVVFARWGIHFLTQLLAAGLGDSDEPLALAIGLNWRVLAVTAALSLLTGTLFGLAPAIQATRVNIMPALRTVKPSGSRGSGGRRLSLRGALVVSQIAFTLLLLVAAGLFLRTLSNLQSIQLGFNAEQLLTLQLNARQAGLRDPGIMALYDRLRTEFMAIPGVRSVTLSDMPLMGTGYSGTNVTLPDGVSKNSHVLTVGPRFFATLQIPLLRGREIEERDRPGAPYAAVVNQRFSKLFFGNLDPVGRHVMLKRACPGCDIEIVGVVSDTLFGQLKSTTFSPAGPPPTIFVSYSQAVWGPVAAVTYELRTAGSPLAVIGAVRDIVRHADARVPVMHVKTQRALIDGTINQEVTFARLCTAFALLALTIACIGLYATMSHGVAQRTSEIGVRMALGARRGTVVWMVLREVVVLTAVGLVVSLPAALAASKLVESFLYGMKRNDPLALTAAVMTMVSATLIAGYLPARHAAHINPMTALRHE